VCLFDNESTHLPTRVKGSTTRSRRQINQRSSSHIMSYSPPNYSSQTPSRAPPPQDLSIRTTSTLGQTATQQTPSPPNQQRPYPVYPLPIAPEKFERAVILFEKYSLAEGLAQREPNRLEPPRRGERPQSVSSHGSSDQHTPSTRNGGTVVSFGEGGSPSSAAANASSELTSYDGRKVKTRTRRPLSPVARARAALIRHLGSCWVCRSRRVPCPLEHHDIARLQTEMIRRRRQPQSRPQPSPIVGRDTRATTLPGPQRPNFIATTNVMGRTRSDPPLPNGLHLEQFELTGLGQNEELMHHHAPMAGFHSPLYPEDPLRGMQGGEMAFPDINFPAGLDLSEFTQQDPYSNHQNGALFALGVRDGWYYRCRHLEGNCQQIFDSEEHLQAHFETHFAYTRVLPPQRYVCVACKSMSEHPIAICYSCQNSGTIEHLIMGSYIRQPSYQAFGTDGHDSYGRNTFSDDPFTVFNLSDVNINRSQGMENNGNGSTSSGGFYRNSNVFPGSGTASRHPSNGFNTYDVSQPGGFNFQGSQFGDGSDIDEPIFVDIINSKVSPTSRWQKPVVVFVAILFLAAFIVNARGWLITKGVAVDIQACLPFLGFMSAIASFVISQKYLAIKHPGSHLEAKSQLSFLQSPLAKLSSSSSIPFNFRPAAPAIHIRGSIFS